MSPHFNFLIYLCSFKALHLHYYLIRHFLRVRELCVLHPTSFRMLSEHFRVLSDGLSLWLVSYILVGQIFCAWVKKHYFC